MQHTILICDDERDIVSALKIYLEADGYATRTAYDGKQALSILADEPIDLVLMDVMMPEMNGLDATRAIREWQGKPKEDGIPIIAMTANAFTEDRQVALDAGMNDHIAKPINMNVLVPTLRKYL